MRPSGIIGTLVILMCAFTFGKNPVRHQEVLKSSKLQNAIKDQVELPALRVLLFAPGTNLYPADIEELQKKIEKNAGFKIEILDRTIIGGYSTSHLMWLQKNIKDIKPDLILYYESSKMLPFDLHEYLSRTLDENGNILDLNHKYNIEMPTWLRVPLQLIGSREFNEQFSRNYSINHKIEESLATEKRGEGRGESVFRMMFSALDDIQIYLANGPFADVQFVVFFAAHNTKFKNNFYYRSTLADYFAWLSGPNLEYKGGQLNNFMMRRIAPSIVLSGELKGLYRSENIVSGEPPFVMNEDGKKIWIQSLSEEFAVAVKAQGFKAKMRK